MNVSRQEMPGGKPGGKLAGAVGGKRNLLIAAAAGTALIAFVMAKSGGGGAASGGGGSDQQMTGYDSTPYDQYNAVQSQLEDIQKQIDDGKVTPGQPTTPPATPASPKPPVKTLPWPPIKPKPVPSKTTGGKSTYVTIKKNDTLSGIAKRSGISMSTLKKLNPGFWSNPKYHQGNTIFAGGKVRTK